MDFIENKASVMDKYSINFLGTNHAKSNYAVNNCNSI